MEVFFASWAAERAIGHYRLQLPAAALRSAGHTAVVGGRALLVPGGPVGSISSDLTLLPHPDIVVLQPGVRSDWSEVAAAAQSAGQRVVVDLDDHWWDVPPVLSGHLTRVHSDWVAAIEATIGYADLVTVSTQHLADYLATWDDPPFVVVLRNPIDRERWGAPEVVTDGPTLGYAGSLYGHAEDCRLFRGWLGHLLADYDLRLIHTGAHPSLPDFAAIADVDPLRVTTRPGHPWANYAASKPMAGMDIGLVSLVDHPFNRAKSALKGMEYAAVGIPFIASASPEYVWLGTGRLVGEDLGDQPADGWIKAIEELLDAPVRRSLAAEQSNRLALEDISSRGADWVTAYEALLEAPR